MIVLCLTYRSTADAGIRMPTYLFLSFLLLGALVWLYLRRRVKSGLNYKEMRRRFPDAYIAPVRFLPQEVVAAGQLPDRAAAVGYLILQADCCVLIGEYPGTGASEEWVFTDGVEVALCPQPKGLSSIPELLILRGDKTRFLYADRKCAGMGAVPSTRELYSLLLRRFSELNFGLRHAPSMASVYALAALLLGGVASVIYHAATAVPDFGLTTAVTTESGLWASSSRELVRLDRQEQIVQTLPWRSVGVAQGAADLVPLDEQTLLVGDFESGEILRCDLAKIHCAPLPVFEERDFRFKRTFKFVLAPDGETILAADTARHRLVQLAIDSADMTEIDLALCFPNRIRIGPAQQLVLADTNNHRLLEWSSWQHWRDQPPQTHSLIAAEHKARDCRESRVDNAYLERPVAILEGPPSLPGARRGRIWPTDFDWHSDGTLWVMVGDADLRYPDLLLFDSRWRLRDIVSLPADLDLIQVLGYADEMLLLDPAKNTLLVSNDRGDIVRRLAPNELEVRVAGLRERYEALQARLQWSVSLVVICLLLTLVLSRRLARQWLRSLSSL